MHENASRNDNKNLYPGVAMAKTNIAERKNVSLEIHFVHDKKAFKLLEIAAVRVNVMKTKQGTKRGSVGGRV